jgi:hypothetical protein
LWLLSSQEEVSRSLGLLKLPGQETQLSILGTLKLILYTTGTEGYGMHWNTAEREVRKRIVWNMIEAGGSYWGILHDL